MIKMLSISIFLSVSIALFVVSCGGGGGGGGNGDSQSTQIGSGGVVVQTDGGCNGFCTNANSFLSSDDVQQIIAQAVAEAQARGVGATIAVVDRVGNVLAVSSMNGALATARITSTPPGVPVSGGLEGIVVPATLTAIAKAITGAYLSAEGNAFTTRTASQVIQENFNPGEFNQPGGPLFGIQFSQLPCSDLSRRYPDDGMLGPKRSPLGFAADPGGFSLYKNGAVVGAVGIMADGIYELDKNLADFDINLDELIGLAATVGFDAPSLRRADVITADGKTLRYSDASINDLASIPANAPAYSMIDGTVTNLVDVTGYYASADGVLSGTAFGEPESGIRPDTEFYPGRDAFVMVDAANNPLYPPQVGMVATLGTDNLTAQEVQQLINSGLDVANRARSQVRRPLGSQARENIVVVDADGNILGVARTRDAIVDGLDVTLQKARTAAYFSSAAVIPTITAVPDAEYLDSSLAPIRTESLTQYLTVIRSFYALPTVFDGSFAFSSRAISNITRPDFPDGLVANPNGPLSKPDGEWSIFSTGLELDLVYNAIIAHVGFVIGALPTDVGRNCTGISGLSSGVQATAPIPNIANGIQIFGGGVPIYRDGRLVGAIAASGDGTDQSDLVAFLGLQEAAEILVGVNAAAGRGNITQAPPSIRADMLVNPSTGLRARYVNCPQAPFLNSDTINACAGL